ncbi:MAG: enoyl-CoA hydratase/isomerase family protein [Alphaproteobacteria bacterium]|nr:enoyl-CoA hydratase/isomerase family protein [Alphaproteobacteria bacterium]
MTAGSVTLERRGAAAVITLRAPPRNAMHLDMWHQLDAHVATIAGTRAFRAAVITGAGGHFCAGMDVRPDNPVIARLAPSFVEGDPGPARALLDELKGILDRLGTLPVPVVAAIDGACAGGGLEIALACDVRLAADTAYFALRETRMGMIPDLGGTVRLARLLGPGAATDLILTGRRVDATEALQRGLVERLTDGAALEAALAWVDDLALSGPFATARALEVLRVASRAGEAPLLAMETEAGAAAISSGEPPIGVQAFLTDTAPRWETE